MAKIYLKEEKTVERYGLSFNKGIAETDNKYLIEKLKKKGFKVEEEAKKLDKNSKGKDAEEEAKK